MLFGLMPQAQNDDMFYKIGVHGPLGPLATPLNGSPSISADTFSCT